MYIHVHFLVSCARAYSKYINVSFIDTHMVRSYILSKKEREIIKEFLQSDEKLSGFRLVRSRIMHLVMIPVEEDLRLIKAFKEKMRKEPLEFHEKPE